MRPGLVEELDRRWPPLGLRRELRPVEPLEARFGLSDEWLIVPDVTESGDSPSPVAWDLMEPELGLFAVTRLRRLVAVHAAVIVWNGRALIVPAASGGGKSILSIAAAAAGAGVLSDEYALIDPGTGLVTGWRRPVRRRRDDGSIERLDRTAAAMRAVLGWDSEARARCRTWDEALTQLREAAESAGVLVMISGIVGSDTNRKLDPDEFHGFALADAHAALAFVNGTDSKAAQVFTLAHELAHLWLGETALSDVDLGSIRANTVERWCNHVAAELLAPIDEFRVAFDPSAGLRDQLQPLAERFRASTQVILGRVREAGRLSWDEYLHELGFERARVAAIVAGRGAGGNYYNTCPSRSGSASPVPLSPVPWRGRRRTPRRSACSG